jgi:penicillin-binding protein 1A
MADYDPPAGSPWSRFMRRAPLVKTDPFDIGDLGSGSNAPAARQEAPDEDDFEAEEREHEQPSRTRWWVRRGLQGALLFLILCIAWLTVTAPLSKSLEPIVPPRLTLLSADGQPIARNGAIVDRPVKIAALPSHVPQAFIAIEDRRFYGHLGLDPRGIARAMWNNLFGSGTQGASTITQQLAKFTFLTADRTYTRKAREALIAFWLEAWLTKDEILERYLSNAFFGENLYGLRAASLHYYFRQPERLTLAQAATLAGLVQAPSRLAPTRNPKAAAKRARLVLAAMADQGYISPAKAKATGAAPTDVRPSGTLPTGTYFADWAMPYARAQAEEGYGEQKVTTTLDARLQAAARAAVSSEGLGKAQVALVAMKPGGEVVAMLGGRSYKDSSFNRATQARRQPGSTFKLFVYLAALEAGMSPESRIDDTPIVEGQYRPKNYGDRYRGSITLRQAFAQSSNVATVRLFQKLGPAAVIRVARRLGVRSPLTQDESLALGSSGITLLELTSAYGALAADKWPLKPRPLAMEEQGMFASLLNGPSRFGADERVAMLDMMAAVINEGTGRAARLNIKAYGKTGTSQENRDALFVGFAGDLIVGVWVGNDDNTPLKGVTGGSIPARIWRNFMGRAIKGAAPVPKPVVKKRAPDPEGPVFPLDLPDIPDVPIDLGNSQIGLDDDKNLRIQTDVGGIPLDVRLGKDGVSFGAGEGKTEKPQR